jgi:hypothetical protein
MELVAAAECIFYLKKLLSPELCGALIRNYRRDGSKHPGHTLGSHGETKTHDPVKVSTDLAIPNAAPWTSAHETLHRAVSEVVVAIAAQFPSLQVWPLRTTGYKIQHYQQNAGYFHWHFDALGPGAWERQLAMVIFLNSVAQGGATCFHRQNLRFQPVAGDGLFFPTFWTHMHCGEVPRSEDKYIVSTFVCFDIPHAPPAAQRP